MMIAENIQNIEENLKKSCLGAGRDPGEVSLVCVSKTFSAENIIEAIDAGASDFGEKYDQELVEKRNSLLSRNIRWHFIGHLQSNKVKYIAECIHMIHSVDSVELAKEIQKRAERSGRTIDILVEVNTSEEATKFGVRPADAAALIDNISAFPNLSLKGLMTIGPFTENMEESRASFRSLKQIFDRANNSSALKQPMTILSMGMTHDYQTAIEEGSTMIRIGTAIFGKRSQQIN